MKNQIMNKPTKYPKPMIAIHWLSVILLATVFIIGKGLEEFEFNEANMDQYRKHAILGMLLLILTVVRIVIKRKNKNNIPAEITYYSEAHKKLVTTILKLIYAFLIITPLTGFIMIFQTGAMAADFGGPFPTGVHFNEILEVIHKASIFILVTSVVMHIVGVILYKIKTGENLIKRMCMLLK